MVVVNFGVSHGTSDMRFQTDLGMVPYGWNSLAGRWLVTSSGLGVRHENPAWKRSLVVDAVDAWRSRPSWNGRAMSMMRLVNSADRGQGVKP